MAIICPTVLASDPQSFKDELSKVEPFSGRIQIDLTDGLFVEPKTVNLAQVYWPVGVKADLHLMFRQPSKELETIIAMAPNLVILHKEASESLLPIFEELGRFGIKCGVALLPDTTVESASKEIAASDHVLIFSGHLGSFGGEAKLELLGKIDQIKAINEVVEIGWDGGANDKNVAELAQAGVDVINVGGYLQNAENPHSAYAILESIISGGGS